jgi:hypothetical protein
MIVASVASSTKATHIPAALDVPTLRPDVGGYLEFINPIEHPGLIGTPVPASPPGAIETEEHTGYTLASGIDVVEVGDGDVTHGDRADFDWVQEHRSDEFAGISNHPGLVGAMGWCAPLSPGCTPTEASPHVDPGTGLPHGHSVAELPPGTLPELINPDYNLELFNAVDVFSIISVLEDSSIEIGSPGSREAALDYEVAFGNSITGASSPGVPVIVWVPGWTAATTIDDYVARWVPADGGLYNLVAIEPAAGFGHDEITEIDGIKALMVPEPSAVLLVATGFAGLAWRMRRH